MIDTVTLKYNMRLTDEQLKNWVLHTVASRGKKLSERYVYNVKIYSERLNQSVPVKCTYRPADYKGKPLLMIELSVANAVYGFNYLMVKDIPEAIKCINELLASDPAIPVVDAGEGTIHRLDICYNHSAGDYVQEYINALSSLEYPHRQTKPYKGQGVVFLAKKINTKFYDKGLESGESVAEGILRQETSIRDPKTLEKMTGKKRPRFKDLTREMIEKALRTDLDRLGIYGIEIASVEKVFEIMEGRFGLDKALMGLGVLTLKIANPKKKIRSKTKMSPRSLDRKFREFRKSKVASTLTSCKEPLPPLVIELF